MSFMIKQELEERRKRYNGGEEETLNPARLEPAVSYQRAALYQFLALVLQQGSF